MMNRKKGRRKKQAEKNRQIIEELAKKVPKAKDASSGQPPTPGRVILPAEGKDADILHFHRLNDIIRKNVQRRTPEIRDRRSNPEEPGFGEQARTAQMMVDVLRQLIERGAESLRIYEPLPIQQAFHASKAKKRLIRGGNQSGKTLSAAIEVARAMTCQDPFNKYPKTGIVYAVTEEWDEVGEVLYSKLFRKGAFKIIRDRNTGNMRTYRIWDPDDLLRIDEAKESDPLIPPRLIKSIAWYNQRLRQPAMVVLKTGWEIHFFSGKSSPPSGSQIDLAWLDEEIPIAEWFIELNSRLLARGGRLIWSATPEIGTEQFHNYCLMAEDMASLPPSEREIEQFHITLKDNPHISEQSKREMMAVLSDQDYQIRVMGEFANTNRRVVPQYNISECGIEYFNIPSDWTHYAAIDPGYQICAVLFASVPPPDIFGRSSDSAGISFPADEIFKIVLWDELYIPKCSASKFGELMAEKVSGKDFEDFVIDLHGSKITDVGSGLTVYEQYANELKMRGIRCRRHGSGFASGSDDKQGAAALIREMMSPNKLTGKPLIRILCNRNSNGQFISLLPNLHRELQRWQNKIIRDRDGNLIATDDPEDRGQVHLCAALRYLLMHNPRYVAQTHREPTWNNPQKMMDYFDRLTQRHIMGFRSNSMTFTPSYGGDGRG